jgi:diguanylate cyclase (GGDEF)-like protein
MYTLMVLRPISDRRFFIVLLQVCAVIVLSCTRADALDPSRAVPQSTQITLVAEAGFSQNSEISLTQSEGGHLWTGAPAWSLQSDDRQIEAFLEPDSKVLASNGAQVLVMCPPQFCTPAAYVGYVLGALLITWGAVSLRTRSLVRNRRELERIVAERTQQLESEKQALVEARQALQIQATRDSLTGVWNRAAVLEHLEREMARAEREQLPLGVVLADLDHFKNINDRYGHLCGDAVLREAAQRLLESMREYDLVGRYGGEEFLILLPGCDLHQTPGRVEELVGAIGSMPCAARGVEVPITCSFGVATFQPGIDSLSIEDVLNRADEALYFAKRSGRNCAGFEARLVQRSAGTLEIQSNLATKVI